ncbi:BolA/IbaG family iron-sulfur metabolism protein [Buchnera aphidicola]|uniref:BolA/IbaG family iron-sulfur metabolism protein n=1 Tax=Buchnera aphidicola TaxID=9 RepID=UPI0031B86095
MKNEKLKLHIIKHVELKKLYIEGNEDHIDITAIGNIFNGISNIKRQQLIYKPITKYILEKKIHAITIHTFTEQEWKNKKNKF